LATRNFNLLEIAGAMVRRRWWILLPFALGLAAAPVLARLAPERFRSEALLLVIPQQVPNDYVTPTMTQSIEERLPAITDQILSRSRLEQIIRQMDLYQSEQAHEVMEDTVQRMRKDVTTSPARKDVNSFRVTYVSDSAEKARKVTERLASLYIEQNLQDRENQANNTSQFLTAQLDEAKQRLIEQEKKLEEYRKSHAGQLPSQLQGNLQAIQTASLQLQSLNESTNRAQERRLLIERQRADTEVVPLPTPAPAPAENVAPSTEQQLELARARLNFIMQRYTPEHPEVVSLQRTVAELSTKLEGETPGGGTDEKKKEGQNKSVTPAEAAQQKKILDFQAELAVIDYQLAANRTEAARLQAVISGYQSKVDIVPTRESELVELTRDYGTMQAAYTNLLVKRENSMLAGNLERRQIGEQFKLLDTASMPERPYNQLQRLAVMASGAGLGLVLGLLAVAFREYRDRSFKSEEEVVKSLSVPVLALIPAMRSKGEHRAARLRSLALDAGGVAVLLASAAIVVGWRLWS
jgi:polysaccharide chain length determinant protein (PEP-CTERM system associated)